MVKLIKEGKDLSRMVAITFDDGFADLYTKVYPLLQKTKLPATVFVTTGFVGAKWPFDYINPAMLTWKQIEEMSKNEIEIGAHTVNHPNLLKINLEEAKNEILSSKLSIEHHIKKNVKYFCYPFGRFNSQTVDIVKSMNFAAALGGIGTIQKNSDLFALNRVQVESPVSIAVFKARLTNGVDWQMKLEQTAQNLLQKLR